MASVTYGSTPGFRECYGDEINPDVPVQHQIVSRKIVLTLFNSLWQQMKETHRRLERTGGSYTGWRDCPFQE